MLLNSIRQNSTIDGISHDLVLLYMAHRFLCNSEERYEKCKRFFIPFSAILKRRAIFGRLT